MSILQEIYRELVKRDEVWLNYNANRKALRPLPFTIDDYFVGHTKVESRESRKKTVIFVLDRVEQNEDKIVCACELSQTSVNGVSFYNTELTTVAVDYQGRGIAKQLYIGLVKDCGVSLINESGQSPGSAKNWARISSTPGIRAYLVKHDNYDTLIVKRMTSTSRDRLVTDDGETQFGHGKSVCLVKSGSPEDRFLRHAMKEYEKRKALVGAAGSGKDDFFARNSK